MIRYKVLYLCFSSEQAAEAYAWYAAQGASKEKSAETVLYDAKKEGPQLAAPLPLEEIMLLCDS